MKTITVRLSLQPGQTVRIGRGKIRCLPYAQTGPYGGPYGRSRGCVALLEVDCDCDHLPEYIPDPATGMAEQPLCRFGPGGDFVSDLYPEEISAGALARA